MNRFKFLLPALFAVLLISLNHSHCYAQSTDVDEAFDPFSDYNEFEQDADEEADIDFFKNGRYLTLGLQLGYRGFTGGGFAQAYSPNFIYGVQFSYFFDMQLAVSLGFSMGDHNVEFSSTTRPYAGNVNIQTIDANIKYYFNTDNVTKGLADLNPYFFGGGGQYQRAYSLNNVFDVPIDRVFGAKAGFGLEIPMMRRRGYLGLQGTFHLVQFPDENKRFIDEGGGVSSPVSPSLNGDIFDVSMIVGVNF